LSLSRQVSLPALFFPDFDRTLLTSGRFRWREDQVTDALVAAVEEGGVIGGKLVKEIVGPMVMANGGRSWRGRRSKREARPVALGSRALTIVRLARADADGGCRLVVVDAAGHGTARRHSMRASPDSSVAAGTVADGVH
jgi:hypothetical protein